jgi:hypothetical protein
MANMKVELEQVSDDKFKVLKLTNRLEPSVGSVIDKREVKSLLEWRKKLTVVIVPRKG